MSLLTYLVGRIVLGHVGVSVLFLVEGQLVPPFLPGGRVRVPHKANLFEEALAGVRQRGAVLAADLGRNCVSAEGLLLPERVLELVLVALAVGVDG